MREWERDGYYERWKRKKLQKRKAGKFLKNVMYISNFVDILLVEHQYISLSKKV